MRQDHNLVTNATSSLFSNRMKKISSGELKDQTCEFCVIHHNYTLYLTSPSQSCSQVFSCYPAMGLSRGLIGRKTNLRTDFTRCRQQKKGQTSLLVFTHCTQKQRAMNLASWCNTGLKKMNTNLNGSRIMTANQAAAQTCEKARLTISFLWTGCVQWAGPVTRIWISPPQSENLQKLVGKFCEVVTTCLQRKWIIMEIDYFC